MSRRQRIRAGSILVSFFLFPSLFYYLSPVLVLQASRAGTVNGSLVVFAVLLFAALFLGRAYCGWLCPAAGCQEALFAARDRRIRKGNGIKWLLWLPWIGAIALLAFKAGGYRRVDFFYQTTHGLSIGDVQSFVVYNLVLFVLIVIPALLFGRRAFCHYLCWMAPFMIIGAAIRNRTGLPALRLRASPDACVHCHDCTDRCPMSLPVERMVQRQSMEHPECILCGTCVDGCAQAAISFSLAPSLTDNGDRSHKP